MLTRKLESSGEYFEERLTILRKPRERDRVVSNITSRVRALDADYFRFSFSRELNVSQSRETRRRA